MNKKRLGFAHFLTFYARILKYGYDAYPLGSCNDLNYKCFISKLLIILCVLLFVVAAVISYDLELQ